MEALPSFEMPQYVIGSSSGRGLEPLRFGWITQNIIASRLGYVTQRNWKEGTDYLVTVTCRELLHSFFDAAKTVPDTLYYGLDKNSVDPAVKNLRWVENRLGIEKTKLSLRDEFYERKHVFEVDERVKFKCLRIELADFWRMNPIRFQFFTALLKASVESAKTVSLLNDLLQLSYFKTTKDATQDFLDGKTWFRDGKGIGWVYCFNEQRTNKLERPADEDVIKRADYLIATEKGDWNKAVIDIWGTK